ncbi:MAG TPA: MtrB/PioB family decaheme-associated outer membrane protein, partial [Gammaproteobacteria bacterium]
AQVDTSEWQCEYCPFVDGYDADIEAGATYVSDDTEQLGSGSGYDESGGYVNGDGEGLYAKEGYRLEWLAEDLGLDSRILEIEGGHPGRFAFRLAYSELPYRRFDTTRTVYTATSADTLALPADWVTASRTSDLTALRPSLRAQVIESDRKTLSAGAEIEAGSDFSVFVDYRRRERDGVDIVSASNFSQSVMLPRVLDFETDLIDAGIAYSKGPFNLRLAWFGSFFSNNADSLSWDNPFSTFPGAGQGRHAQEPDNEFRQLSLSGSYAADAINSVIAFSAATGEGEQTQQLLPYTINPLLAAGSLPRSSLDGKVDTTNYAVTLTSRPTPKARVKLAYRYDERDNQTPQSQWSRVIVDGFLSGDAEFNVPYSFERSTLNLSAAYALFDSLRISAGYDRKDIDRSFQEVSGQTEDAGWGRLRWRPTASIEVTVKGGAGRRDIDSYDEALAVSLGQNPLLRKYHLAYRYREFGELSLSYAPAEKPYSVTLNALYADDSYRRSELGMLEGNELSVAADFGWTVSEKTSVYLNASMEDIESEQAGSSAFGVPNWRAIHDDDFTTIGAGLHMRGIADKVDLQLDYTRSNGATEISVDTVSIAPGDFPELESDYDYLRLRLSYRQSERLAVNLNLRYQRFKAEDWALEGVGPASIDTVLSLGAYPYSPEFYTVGIGF